MYRATTARLVVATLAVFLLSCSRLTTDPNDSGWRLMQGHVERFSFAPFRQGRECWIYLPPGYMTSDARYPVLYVNDGASVLTGGVHANRICEDLIRTGEIEPLIIVAVSVPDSERFWDYAPWSYRNIGGGGDNYVRALRDTLKPEIDRRFRTHPDRIHTAIAGYSLGGLISAYAGFAYDSTFGKVGACSPTYGWYTNTSIYDIVAAQTIRSRLPFRYYQDSGYPDDNYIGRMEQLLIGKGYINGINLMSVTLAGAEHAVPAWKHRFPDMLRFLFNRNSALAN